MIAGVAGGLGEHFGIDVTLIRVLWVAAVVFGGFGVLLYLILWIALPEEGATSMQAVRIAEERYARGEISKDELDRIRADLRGRA